MPWLQAPCVCRRLGGTPYCRIWPGNESQNRLLLPCIEVLPIVIAHHEDAEIARILILDVGPLPSQLAALPDPAGRVDRVVVADVAPRAASQMPASDPFEPSRSSRLRCGRMNPCRRDEW